MFALKIKKYRRLVFFLLMLLALLFFYFRIRYENLFRVVQDEFLLLETWKRWRQGFASLCCRNAVTSGRPWRTTPVWRFVSSSIHTLFYKNYCTFFHYLVPHFIILYNIAKLSLITFYLEFYYSQMAKISKSFSHIQKR